MSWDSALFQSINGLAGQSSILDWLGVFLASYLAYFLILAAVILFFRVKERFYYFAFTALALLLSSGFLTPLIHLIYNRPRPFLVLTVKQLISHSPSAAFPSGHAAFFFALAGVVWYANRRWGYWFLAGAILIGLARVFVGIHWPTDILAGAVVGLLSAIAVKYLLRQPMRK